VEELPFMDTQNYANHTRLFPPFHFVLLPVLLLTLGGSITNLCLSWGDHARVYSASLILVLNLCVITLALCSRVFSLKAQDRAIRAEENLRHFVLTGKLLDSKLTIRQVIGLRFAPDAEFVALAQRAASERLSEDDIKKAVKNWKADTYRV
jgi:hypothetical protein